MSDRDRDLLKQAIIHIKAGELNMARRYLERAEISVDDLETKGEIYFQLSQITEDPKEKRQYLEETLAINPTDARARRSLAILDGKLKPDEIINPDALPTPNADTANASARRFTCTKCGGRMVFDGDGRTLVCESCGVRQSPNGEPLNEEQDFFIAMASGKGHRKPVSMQAFTCQGCGAEFFLPPQVISQSCAYCESAHVVSTTKEIVAPDVILPMLFNRKGAATRLVKWVERNKIIPQGKVQAPHGLYLPVWTFDISGNAPWSGVIYRNKQVVPTSGLQSFALNDLCVPGSRKMSALLEKTLAEYDFKEAPAYDPSYLAGWPAEVYETAMSDASLEARSRAVNFVRRDIQSRNSNVQQLKCTATDIAVTSFRLALVPLWLTEYQTEDEHYRVLINGQTGTVHGEMPSRGIKGWLEGWLGE